MKNSFIKLICLFTFILSFVQGVYASAININSVVYDNSGSFLSINSYDNGDFSFNSKPQLYIDKENRKAYFDISPAILTCPLQNIIINNSKIEQITVSQQSRSEEIVRVAFAYLQGFNPAGVRLKKLNNTLFLQFSQPAINNYYFQSSYLEKDKSEVFEPVIIQTPVQVGGENLLGQINSAFDIGTTKNYVLVKKNLFLQSKIYINAVKINSGIPVIQGSGSYTISKPFYLTNPARVVYDIDNAVVNPVIRNKSIPFGDSSIRLGQFDKNTVRVVISSNHPEKYIPIVFPDTQKLAFADKADPNVKNLFNSQSVFVSSKYDRVSPDVHSAKFIFNAPVVFGIDRTSDKIGLNIYNAGSYAIDNIKKSLDNTPFSDVKISQNSNGILNLSFPAVKGDNIDIHIGADGKTLRIKKTSAARNTENKTNNNQKKGPVQEQGYQMPALNLSEVVPALRKNGKKSVVIDAGHGGSDYGALRGDINEKDINLDVAKKVEKLLVKKGYIVKMTRTKDIYVSLQERVDISEAFTPDVFVSIHVNSSNSESPYGLETHYYKDNSLGLAKCVHAALLNNVNSKDRGLFKSRFYVINHTTAPAILVEIGFISNPKERAQLVTESRKDATAKAIADGIDDYFRK